MLRMNDMKIENVLGALALALADNLLQSADAQAPEPGVAAAALALLGHAPGMSIEQLRRALRLSHPGTVRLVDRLVAREVVERRASQHDRRAVALYLTPTGEGGCTAILDARQAHTAQMLTVLDATERETLGRLCEKLLRGLVRDEDHALSVCRLCDPAVCTGCPIEAGLNRL